LYSVEIGFCCTFPLVRLIDAGHVIINAVMDNVFSGKNTAQAEIYKSTTHCTIVGIPTWHSDTAFQCGLLTAACSIPGGCKAVVSKAVLSVRLDEHVEQDIIFASLQCMRITIQLAGVATFPVASIAEVSLACYGEL
jgi:hypothetical protein